LAISSREEGIWDLKHLTREVKGRG
jgi:hypothetical protein